MVIRPLGPKASPLAVIACVSVSVFASATASAQSAPPPEARPNVMPAEPAATVAVDPSQDQQKLAAQRTERPTADGTIGNRPSEVYSEDWWGHTRPILELHGYFRTRAELFHNFSLGRHGDAVGNAQYLWAQPLDNSYLDTASAPHAVTLCGTPGPKGELSQCENKSQAGANLRLRLNPEIHISDNLRILSQVDMLDNLVLGSTPDSYALQPSTKNATGYSAAGNGYNAYAPLSAFSTTQGAPTAGVNGYRNSIEVKRAWAEYLTPFGQLRFGRMPFHWGLGMLYNSGDGLDHDYQTNMDRIMFVSGVKSADLYFGGSWDFVSSGPTNTSPYDVYGGQSYNVANLSNVNQWSAFLARRMNQDVQRLSLSRGDIVVNGGVYASYRSQLLDVDQTVGNSPTSANSTTPNNGFERRGMWQVMPDAWVQFLWRKLRVEAEFAMNYGSIENSPASSDVKNPLGIQQFGLATQTEFKAIEDKLRLAFGAGWASGDPWQEGLVGNPNGLQKRLGGNTMSQFAFHPSYQVDLILHRRLLTRVQGTYYFRPSVDYDFIRNPNGQKFGGGAAIVWTRASEFQQTPGNKRDLGVELDLTLYYQAKDGSLNDDPSKMGGFYSALQYGVLFPLGGFNYLPGETTLADSSTSAAQTLRLILGVMF